MLFEVWNLLHGLICKAAQILRQLLFTRSGLSAQLEQK